MLTGKVWSRDVLVEIDAHGRIAGLTPGARDKGAPVLSGVAIPGVPNAHSHAHQRLLAGLAETGVGRGNFMRWRELMYAVIHKIDPESFQAVAALAYMEMLKSGYTSVGEFHYLHHDVDGSPYAQPEEMGLRCIAAAAEAGIAMTLLPSLYAHGGFGARAARPEQSRFVCDSRTYIDIYSALHKAVEDMPKIRLGFAPHSMRAVDEALMLEVLTAVREIDYRASVHIHVAEQRSEVKDCIAWCGAPPVQRLLERMPVDLHWNLVHATHMNASERRALAAAQATVVVCPTTEANLGDGVFTAPQWLESNGAIAIGSDSQVTICPAEEMRLFEYVQRLVTESRNVLAIGVDASLGRLLLECVLSGGAYALAQPCGVLAEGVRADIVVLDEEHPALVARSEDEVLDSWIFSGGAACVRDVFVGGRQVVSGGRHVNESAIVDRYRKVAEGLLQ